jgi:molybdopterin-guanine dinucleotide biosynthesis protein A
MGGENASLRSTTGAILAGGRGERVGGRDKGLLALCGRPLVAHVVAALQPQVEGIVIVANRNRAEYSAYGLVLADREAAFRGPLAGIDAALAACSTAWLLTVPVDCPGLPGDLAQRLHAAAVREAAAACVVAVEGRREPLFALYRVDRIAPPAAALAADGAVWQWQASIGAIAVDFSDQRDALANLNDDAGFRAWEKDHA